MNISLLQKRCLLFLLLRIFLRNTNKANNLCFRFIPTHTYTCTWLRTLRCWFRVARNARIALRCARSVRGVRCVGSVRCVRSARSAHCVRCARSVRNDRVETGLKLTQNTVLCICVSVGVYCVYITSHHHIKKTELGRPQGPQYPRNNKEDTQVQTQQ